MSHALNNPNSNTEHHDLSLQSAQKEHPKLHEATDFSEAHNIHEPVLLNLQQLPWPRELPTHYIFDVDGTLANEHSVLSVETNQALQNLYAAGFPIIIATGRPLDWSKFLLSDAKVKGWIVAANGAVVWDGINNEIVDLKLLPENIAREVIETARELNVTYFIETAEEVLVDANNPYIPQVSQVSMQTATGLRDFPSVNANNIRWEQLTKVCFAAPPKRIDQIKELVLTRFPAAVRGGPEFLDVTSENITKLSGIRLAQQRLGLDPRKGLGVGDSGNDVPWLATMGIPVAAPKATADLRAEAKYILPDSANPVADLINAILAR